LVLKAFLFQLLRKIVRRCGGTMNFN